MTPESAHLKQSSPYDLGLGKHTSEQQTGNQVLECSAPETSAKYQEHWSLRNHLQHVLPPDGDIEQLKTVFFRHISPIFCIVDQYDFEQEWQTFKYNRASFTLSWNALLLTILSFAHRAGKEYNRTHDGLSIEFELLAWECLTQDNLNINCSLPGLKALLLLSYLRAHRGLSVSALAAMARRVAQNLFFDDRKEERDVSNGIATLFSLNFHLSKRPGDEFNIVKFQIEDSGTLSMMHAELDEMSYRISEYVTLDYSHREDQLERRLEFLLSSLQARKQGFQSMDGNYVNHSILECRLYYLVHYLSRPDCLLTGPLGKDRCINAARRVLYIFQALVLQENQPMWWYLNGLGSYYATDCALTLAKYSDQDERLLDHTSGIFNSIASHSAFCMHYLPEIEEARFHRLLFLH